MFAGEPNSPRKCRPRCRGDGRGQDGGGEDGACVMPGRDTSSAGASWIGEALADRTGAAGDDGAAELGVAELGAAVAAAAGTAAAW